MSDRLTLALEGGATAGGRVLAVGLPAGTDLSAFGTSDITIVQEMMPDAADWQRRGFRVLTEVPQAETFDAALVAMPRAKTAARDWVARAVAVTTGMVFVDGQKTDGIESLYRDLRKRLPVAGSVTKAHGRLFWFAPTEGLGDWTASNDLLDGRWQVRPGVFSADAVDPGSALLADAIPSSLSGRVADLGAGWGYLSARVLEACTGVTEIHLVEAQASALECARVNVADPRARFHWADATSFTPDALMDAVVMNPPFHTGRAADPELGRRFIAAAASMLRPGGQLWLVANRHLPYEATLRATFARVEEIGSDPGYKLFRATAGGRKRG